MFEPRRFRTWFFVAELPAGQRTRDVSSESDRVAWLPVAGAMAAADAGEIALMPPTYLTCLEVGRHPTAADVVAASTGRDLAMFTPTAEEEDGEMLLSFPEHLRPLLEDM